MSRTEIQKELEELIEFIGNTKKAHKNYSTLTYIESKLKFILDQLVKE